MAAGRKRRPDSRVTKRERRPRSPLTAGRGRRLLGFLWIVPVLVAGVANVGVLRNDFAYDDVRVIKLLREHEIRLTNHSTVVSSPGVVTTPRMRDQETRPLTYAIHVLDYRVWGDAPFGFHFTSLALHMIATALVYIAALTLAGTNVAALIAALLFAVHPVHVEVIASFANLKDILALIFDLAAFVVWIRVRPPLLRWLTTGVLIALGLASKEVAVAGLPVLLMASEPLRHGPDDEAHPGALQVWTLRVLGFGLGVVVVVGLLWGDRLPYFNPIDIGNATEQQLHGYGAVLANVALGTLRLLGQLVVPVRLSADYPLAADATLTSPAVLLGLALLAVLIVTPLGLYRRFPRVALAAGWLIVMYLPISNLVPLVHFFAADRYAYVPSFGYCVLFGMAIEHLDRHATRVHARLFLVAIVALVLVLLTLQTVRRVADWKNDLSLWSSASRAGYETYRIRHKLGVALLVESDANADSAARELTRAIALRPGIVDDHVWLAGAFFSSDRPVDAWREANTVLRADSTNAICRFIRGELLLQRADSLRALADYRATLAADSSHFGAMMRIVTIDLAHASERPGDLDEAVALARRAARFTTDGNSGFHQQAVELVRQADTAMRLYRH